MAEALPAIAAYPLAWPALQPRARARRDADFKVPLVVARDELLAELKRLGAREIVISSNAPVRQDGIMYADVAEPPDPGVAVYFNRHKSAKVAGEWTTVKTPFVIACDSYRKLRWNVRAIGHTVEALRTISRHGATELLEQAFTGFLALPPHIEADPPWWEVLGVSRDATADQIRAAQRELARTNHPDAGGDAARMAQINRAAAAATQERGAA